MKKARKGLTLVEIIVAIAVFSIVSIAFFTSYVSMNKVVARQEEYTRFEMICYDINYYWDMYGADVEHDGANSWDKKYFGSSIQERDGIYTAYFDDDFKPQSSSNGAVYELRYTYSNTKQLIIQQIVKITENNKVIVEGVNCGTREVAP